MNHNNKLTCKNLVVFAAVEHSYRVLCVCVVVWGISVCVLWCLCWCGCAWVCVDVCGWVWRDVCVWVWVYVVVVVGMCVA